MLGTRYLLNLYGHQDKVPFHLKTSLIWTIQTHKSDYVRHLSIHDCFRDFPIEFDDVMCSIGTYVGLKLKAVIPKAIWRARLNELPIRPILQFLHFSFGCISPWVEWLYLFQVTWWLLEFPVKLAKDHIIGIVTYYSQWHPILLKK